MQKPTIAAIAALMLAGCGTPDQNTAIGALAGAAAGASLVGDEDETEAILIGGALGAAVGSQVGTQQARNCVYRNTSTGQQYTAPCPS